MEFEFNNQLVPQSLVEIDEIGEFAIEAHNDIGAYYYLVVKTTLGMSTIATCGPIVPDIEYLPKGFQIKLDIIPYKEDKLTKIINMFLNDNYKCLTEAVVVDVDTALDQFRDVGTYLKNHTGVLE